MVKWFEKSEKHDDTAREYIERSPTAETGELDTAFAFLRDHETINTQHICLKKLRRKLDWHLVPLLFFLHLAQTLDEHLINYAIIMGLPEDLHLKGQELSNIVSSIKWIDLAACAVVGLYLNKAPISSSLGWAIIFFGILSACTAAVQNYPQLLAIRLLMGVLDSVFHPAMILVTSQFYRRDEQIVRFQLWWCAQGFSTIFGALISYGFQFVTGSSLESWRIMYLVLGCLTLLVSIWTIFCLPNSPMSAKFLSIEEKVALLRHIAPNQTGVSNPKIRPKQILAVFRDPQVALLCALVIMTDFASGITSNFSSTLIKSFGYTSKQATLLSIPGGAVAVIACFLSTWMVRREYLQRWSTLGIAYALALVGSCLVAFSPLHNQAAHLAGIYLFYFSTATVGMKYQWAAANIAGHTKRPITMALISASDTIGMIAGPYAVQRSEKPHYHTAKYSLVGAKTGCLLLVFMLALYYLMANRSKDRKFGKRESMMEDDASDQDSLKGTWANLTDTERANFRYVY
ncbi:hypothetical protein DOTSEDRAFT_87475 [Dothistroma septosporum NZE10]|uniref:Major facilitator superfamily (MFS) profile domain-containing protein n=1 Tax=Dothistroma septosporum (strain NZE10 / CBS 128990) TaxID=675120 RepID=N1PPZ3_DOTSN|nr:hypothetical protein DOTSEDRAFT_87475 [Dothistroma septosporum NZE10]